MHASHQVLVSGIVDLGSSYQCRRLQVVGSVVLFAVSLDAAHSYAPHFLTCVTIWRTHRPVHIECFDSSLLSLQNLGIYEDHPIGAKQTYFSGFPSCWQEFDNCIANFDLLASAIFWTCYGWLGTYPLGFFNTVNTWWQAFPQDHRFIDFFASPHISAAARSGYRIHQLKDEHFILCAINLGVRTPQAKFLMPSSSKQMNNQKEIEKRTGEVITWRQVVVLIDWVF